MDSISVAGTLSPAVYADYSVAIPASVIHTMSRSVQSRRAMITMKRLVLTNGPRFQSPNTCSILNPAFLSDLVISSRLRKRSSLFTTSTSPVALKALYPFKRTQPFSSSTTSSHSSIGPKGESLTVYVVSRFHSSHARAFGLRLSKARWPPDRKAARIKFSVAVYSMSFKNT